MISSKKRDAESTVANAQRIESYFVAMLVSRRQLLVPEHSAYLSLVGLLHTKFRVFVGEGRGLLTDDALFGFRPEPHHSERSVLVIQLDGSAWWRHRDGGVELREGEAMATLRSRSYGSRQEGRHRSIVVDYLPGPLGEGGVSFAPGRISREALHRLRTVARAIRSQRIPAPAYAADLLAILHAEGLLPEAPVGSELIETPPPSFEQLLSALNRVLSALHLGPALVDLESELGWSRSHIHQILSDFQRTYGFHTMGGWRALVRSWRIPMGAALMSLPEMKTEEAARRLGYGSHRAFCTAFANAGLPSPGAIRGHLQRLS